MKKNIIVFIFLMLLTQKTFPGSSVSSLGTSENNDLPTEQKFDYFLKLPPEIQNLIISFAWSNIDNSKDFENEILNWENIDAMQKNTTSITERNLYGYNGEKTPIYFYVLENGCPIIKTVGNIISDAQPSLLKGLWYADSTVPSTKLFIHTPKNNLFSATIKDNDGPKITSACISVLGDLAITWTKNQNYFVTILKLKNIEQNKKIDLQQNAITLTNIEYKTLRGRSPQWDSIKGSLFMLDGSKIAICGIEDLVTSVILNNALINHIENCDHSIKYIDNHEKPLTAAEKAKRLCIAKYLVNKKNEISL
ncbi:MAG: hypothetical protein WDZ41_02175 [Candidatus Babeliales bacterium]